MSFDACVQPYFSLNEHERETLTDAEVDQRRIVMDQLTRQLKEAVRLETGQMLIGEEQGECVSHIHIDVDHLLDHIKEHCCSYEKNELDLVFKGEQQTRFNQLLTIPVAGIYIPQYFFFPIWVTIEGLRNPIWVGSAPRLMEETGLLTDSLGLDERLVDRMPKFMFANEQEMEDYATELSGDLFFARMSYNILRRLGTECVESSFPILVNFGLLK